MLIILAVIPALDDVIPPIQIYYHKLTTLFEDSEGDSIIVGGISVNPPAAWLIYNAATDLLEGSPTDNSDVNQHQITVSAYNQFGSDKIHATDEPVINLNVVRNMPPTTDAKFLAFTVIADENFTISLDSLFVDPEGFPGLSISGIEIDGETPSFMTYEALPSPHLHGFTDDPDRTFFLVTVKAEDNLQQVGEITFSFIIASKHRL